MMNGTEPSLASPLFESLWMLRHHMEGGLTRLNQVYKTQVRNVYSEVIGR